MADVDSVRAGKDAEGVEEVAKLAPDEGTFQNIALESEQQKIGLRRNVIRAAFTVMSLLVALEVFLLCQMTGDGDGSTFTALAFAPIASITVIVVILLISVFREGRFDKLKNDMKDAAFRAFPNVAGPGG